MRSERARFVAGVDEAGRGPLAGPVVAAACVIPERVTLEGVRDSKSVSAKVRKRLYYQIIARSVVGVGIVGQEDIDRINILNASLLAMRLAVLALPLTPDVILVDGDRLVALPIPQTPVVRGDESIPVISAASIVAKVTRDEIMAAYDLEYPEYGFRRHKGYPTTYHKSVLEARGPSPIHRFSFRPVSNCAGAGG